MKVKGFEEKREEMLFLAVKFTIRGQYLQLIITCFLPAKIFASCPFCTNVLNIVVKLVPLLSQSLHILLFCIFKLQKHSNYDAILYHITDIYCYGQCL